MKILHTSDWHLGASDGDMSLYNDQLFFIDEICEIIDKEKVDVIVIAGDVYDRSIGSAEAMKLYDYAMSRMCIDLGKKVIVIAGNHDSADRLAGCRKLLEKSGLTVLGAIEAEPKIVSYDDVDIYLFPWITEEKVKGLYQDKREDIRTLTDAYKQVCDVARATFNPSKKHIAVAHAFITNSQLSGSDRSAGIAAVGNAIQVDANVFDGFDYVALGHIHGPQNINDTVRYSGTPMPYSFGKEENQEKSVTIIDTDSMNIKIVPLHPCTKRTTLTGTFEELMKGECEEEIKTGYVRLIITDVYVGFERFAQLKEIYPQIVEVKSKSFEGEDSSIRMTVSEFRELENDPMAIFLNFCKDIIDDEPDEHLVKLFEECLEEEPI